VSYCIFRWELARLCSRPCHEPGSW